MKNKFKVLIWILYIIFAGTFFWLALAHKINAGFHYAGYGFVIAIGFTLIADSYKNIIGYFITIAGFFLMLMPLNDYSIHWGYFVGIAIICLLIHSVIRFFANRSFAVCSENSNSGDLVIFSSKDAKITDPDYCGTNATVIFGGYDLDLRDYNFTKDISISTSVIFGSMDIFLPNYVNVNLRDTSIFGGVSNKFKNKLYNENAPTVHINASAIFGGIDIKQ